MELKLEIVKTHTIVVDDTERSVCSPECEHMHIGCDHIVPGPRDCYCNLYGGALSPVNKDDHDLFTKECRAASAALTKYIEAMVAWGYHKEASETLGRPPTWTEPDDPEPFEPSSIQPGPFRSRRCEACLNDMLSTSERARGAEALFDNFAKGFE